MFKVGFKCLDEVIPDSIEINANDEEIENLNTKIKELNASIELRREWIRNWSRSQAECPCDSSIYGEMISDACKEIESFNQEIAELKARKEALGKEGQPGDED